MVKDTVSSFLLAKLLFNKFTEKNMVFKGFKEYDRVISVDTSLDSYISQ
jgi:hypothetical protein